MLRTVLRRKLMGRHRGEGRHSIAGFVKRQFAVRRMERCEVLFDRFGGPGTTPLSPSLRARNAF